MTEKTWHEIGVKAGKTESWMNLEETLAETLRDHPDLARDPNGLVQTDMEGWEETDHFQIRYGSSMMDDAKNYAEEEDEWMDLWQDYKSEFWEGYLEGRQSIGIDIYKKARELLALGRKEGKTRRSSRKGRVAGSPKASVKGIRR